MVLASVTGRAGGSQARDAAAALRREPAVLPKLLEDERVWRAVLGDAEQAAPVSPFLVFTVAVHRSAAELASLDYLPERTGTRQRVPLFDAPALRDFLADP